MRIALIWPNGYDVNYVVPLALAYLKSNISDKHEVIIFDCALNNVNSNSKQLKDMINQFKPDVVGVSCWSNTYLEGLNILKTIKSINKEITTVMGGVHVTSYPDSVIKENVVDFVFRSESETSFPKFIDELKKKKPNFSKISGLVYISNRSIIKNRIVLERNIDEIKMPNYGAIKFMKYLQKGYRYNTSHKMNAPVWVTRGCPYACSFCSASLQNGRVIRKHSIEYMINWIKYLYYEKNIRHINIIDDNFTFDKEYAKEFCRAMINLNLKDLHFGTPNGIRIEMIDGELLKLMKKVRWENMIVAPESGSQKTLKRMKKRLNLDIIPDKIKEIKKAGFKVHGFFIIGYPGETRKDIRKTVNLLRKCKFNFFFLNNFQPLPGTPVYDELVENKKIEAGVLPKNFSGGERVYIPEKLKDFNFPLLVLKEYIYLALSNPLNIPYMMRIINPKIIIEKLFVNLKNSLMS